MLRGNIGYVPQTISLLNDTLRENIIFDGREEDDEKMQMALKLSALDSYCATLPDGLDTKIGDNGACYQVVNARGLLLQERYIMTLIY